MNRKKMLMIGYVLMFGVLVTCANKLDTKVSVEADIEVMLSTIAAKVIRDDSKVAKSIENAVYEYERIIVKDGKETGLLKPRSRSTKLAVVAGRIAIFGSVREKLSNTDTDIIKLLNILQQSYVAEKGTLGKPYSALVYGLICKNLGRYADSLIWLDRAAEGVKESQLLKSIRKSKEEVFREGLDSLKFTGSIAGGFAGTKGCQYSFELYDSADSSAPIFQGYKAVYSDSSYTITNVRPGKYSLIVSEKRDGTDQPRNAYWKVNVEEGKVVALDITLAPRFSPLTPENDTQVTLKAGGVLRFKWEKPARVTNSIYELGVHMPSSTNPPPKGMKGTMIVRNVTEPTAEIPVSEFREKGEYVWFVTLKDVTNKNKPVDPLTLSDSRKFIVR